MDEVEALALSCEEGLQPRLAGSVSIERERPREALDMLLPGLWSTRVPLLNVRQTDDTFDSCSDLLFSLLRFPNPNFRRMEDVLLVNDAELVDRALL